MQQLLRVGSRRQAHFHVIAVVVVSAYQRVLLQKIAIAFIFNLDVALAIAGFNSLEITLKNGIAFIDQANTVTQLLHLVHAMRGKQDCLSLLLQIKHYVFEQRGIERIKPKKWLLHYDEKPIRQQRSDE